jgi:cobalt/nickel transport system permease protein
MHISDGILSPYWIGIWYLVALVFIVLGIIQIKKESRRNPAYIPMLSLMGAAVFIISVWHIPVPVTGSSSHPIGTPMSAILVGPLPTVVISSIALFFQMFLAHGGLTTLGANTFSMGIVGAFSGYITYLLLRRAGASIWISVGMAGLVGDLLTYVTTAFELAVSLHPDNLLYYWTLFALGFLPTQLPLAIGEFVFTAATIRYIMERRPEFLIRTIPLEGSAHAV